jgi:hypothetical protein
MKRRYLPFLLLALATSLAWSDTTITLKNKFISDFRSHVTITTQYTIDKAHASPNSGAKDGDLHVAGRSNDIGLATVAEIMNAKDSPSAVAAVHSHEGGDPVSLTGVWRIWCEHSSNTEQIQGSPLSPFTTTNPDHVFEVHPILNLAGIDLTSCLHPIPGFTEKDATEAFSTYERTPCHITVNNDDTTTIRTVMAGYNYVKFKAIIPKKSEWAAVDDGVFIPVEIQSLDGDRLVSKLYLAFPNGTPAQAKLSGMSDGGAMTLLGIPRISLARVWWRVQHAADRPGDLDWSLPYEIVVVGSY